jgi:hypothetical protein
VEIPREEKTSDEVFSFPLRFALSMSFSISLLRMDGALRQSEIVMRFFYGASLLGDEQESRQ